jgi:phage terminase small subunit
MALNDKQKRFVDEYLIDLNATQAAIRAGYSAKTAGQIGDENLKKPEIAIKIAKRMKDREQRTEITQDRVLLEIARLAFNDPRRAFDSSGNLLPIQQWPDEVAAAISSIKVVEQSVDGEAVTQTKEVKFWDKNSAIEKASKHLGLYEADNKQSNPGVSLIEALNRRRERARAAKP